ncbi:MAG: ribosome maturation factor RimM [Eubacteriales bacterium]|jgi:16S rRNA processing protein RimM
MKKRAEYLECGKIINTHGTDGTLKLESWCDTPQVLAGLKRLFLRDGDGYTEYRVLKSSVFKSFVLAKLAGISDLNTAVRMKNSIVYAARGDIALEEGAHFIIDLIGLPVIDADTRHIYGEIVDVINRGASDIYVIKTDTGETMMPAVAEFVEEIDLDRGVFVRPIEGMFEF